MPPLSAAFILFCVRLAFALLVCNTAAGLASGLAGSLALAATAILCALAKILGFNSLDVLHYGILRNVITLELYHIKKTMSIVNLIFLSICWALIRDNK